MISSSNQCFLGKNLQSWILLLSYRKWLLLAGSNSPNIIKDSLKTLHQSFEWCLCLQCLEVPLRPLSFLPVHESTPTLTLHRTSSWDPSSYPSCHSEHGNPAIFTFKTVCPFDVTIVYIYGTQGYLIKVWTLLSQIWVSCWRFLTGMLWSAASGLVLSQNHLTAYTLVSERLKNRVPTSVSFPVSLPFRDMNA